MTDKTQRTSAIEEFNRREMERLKGMLDNGAVVLDCSSRLQRGRYQRSAGPVAGEDEADNVVQLAPKE